MKYILDTNILSYIEDKKSYYAKNIYKKLSSLNDRDNVCISILSYFEYSASLVYFPNYTQEDILKTQKSLEEAFEVMNLNKNYANIFSNLRKDLKEKRRMSNKKLKLHTVDLLIASTTIVENAILVSNDGIFEDILKLRSNFKFENWTE